MAFEYSPSQGVEVAVGVGGAAVTPANNGLSAFRSPTPAQLAITAQDFQNHSSGWTRQKSAMGRQTWRVGFSFFFQHSSAASPTGAGDDVPRAIGVYEMAGLDGTVTAAPDTFILDPIANLTTELNPASRAAGGGDPGPNAIEVFTAGTRGTGIKRTGSAAYCNLVISGRSGEPVLARADCTAIFAEPTSSAGLTSWATGSVYTDVMHAVACAITPNGGSAYTPVFQSFEFNLNNRVVEIEDANAATGLKEIALVDQAPTLRFDLAQDTDASANLAIADLYADVTGADHHSVAFKASASAVEGRIWNFLFPTAQPIDLPESDNNGYRRQGIMYKVQGTTPGIEFSITGT